MGNEPTPPAENRPPVERLEALVRRARQGDESVLPELRQLLDRCPELWKRCGDLAAQAQKAWIDLVGGVDLVCKESLQRQLDEMRLQLAGTDPTPLESLAVQRVLACWVQVHFADALAAQAQERQAAPAQLRWLQKRQESAGRCLTEAVKQLALARRVAQGRGKAARLAAQDLPGIPLPADNKRSH
jgi:acyl-homoserine lactone acylase PvdQ